MEIVRAETGEASKLDDVQSAFKVAQPKVLGDGHFQIETHPSPARIVWCRSHAKSSKSSTLMSQFVGETPSLDTSLQNVVSAKQSEFHEYESRLAYLRDESADEDYSINPTSESDLRRFIRSQPTLREGDLVLMENGNLRAIWENDLGAQLGLQFLGNDSVQFVAFARRKDGQEITRVTGRDSMSGIVELINVLELRPLLFE